MPGEQIPEEAVAPEAVVEKAPEVVAKEPSVATQIVEGDIDKVDVGQEETREDGTVVRSRVTTTKQMQTVTEIVLTDGVESDRHVSEKLVGTEVDEEVLELCDPMQRTLKQQLFALKMATPRECDHSELGLSARGQETVAVSQVFVVEQVPGEQIPEEAVAPEAVVEKAPV